MLVDMLKYIKTSPNAVFSSLDPHWYITVTFAMFTMDIGKAWTLFHSQMLMLLLVTVTVVTTLVLEFY